MDFECDSVQLKDADCVKTCVTENVMDADRDADFDVDFVGVTTSVDDADFESDTVLVVELDSVNDGVRLRLVEVVGVRVTLLESEVVRVTDLLLLTSLVFEAVLDGEGESERVLDIVIVCDLVGINV